MNAMYWSDEKDLPTWEESVELACRWMIDCSLIRTAETPLQKSVFRHKERYDDWRGVFRGEYKASTGQWDVYCPVWHGGQGVKALALAFDLLGQTDLLDAARLGAEFILRNQVTEEEDPNKGMIWAFEHGAEGVNSSAVLESLEGLFTLADVTGEALYTGSAIAALRWLQRTMFLPEEGLVVDDYLPEKGPFVHDRVDTQMYPQPGRPLLDDGVFFTGGKRANDQSLIRTGLAIADRLLAEEDPSGNWVRIRPARPDTGMIHPRHAYWWGRPMWMAYRVTGEKKYLECCQRSAEWYLQAMRTDGGMFRNTDPSFNTPCFGQATSGIACAALLWIDLVREFGEERWIEPIQRALGFCRSMQFTRAEDENLQGAILEKVLPPDGADGTPWYLRDVGTFFYVQAVCRALKDLPGVFE